MPFMAMWKKLPSWRMGMKKSAATRTVKSTPARPTAPAWNCVTATQVPAAAPQNATRSMMVMELSCMVSTRMVTRRKRSASSFISRCLKASAR